MFQNNVLPSSSGPNSNSAKQVESSATFFILASFLAYFSTLKMEAT
jgi:hypothetical protein